MANRSTTPAMLGAPALGRHRVVRWRAASAIVVTVALLRAAPLPGLSRPVAAESPATAISSPLEVEINRKGLGKEVIVRQGSHEWYMLVEVTPDNTVIVRQHKNGETYLLDESETHDRPFLPQEVDGAIEAFADSAKTQATGHKK